MSPVRKLRKSSNASLVAKVRQLAHRYESTSGSELLGLVAELEKKVQLARKPERFAPEAFAIVDIAIKRTLNISAYDVQLIAGLELIQRRIVEMATGEGKTLTALFALFFRALQGKGVLLATANNYLARRDAEFAQSVFSSLGITVGYVVDDSEDEERGIAYAKHVTYGTASQFGFDFLKDRSKGRFNLLNPGLTPAKKVQRDRLFAVIVDEVDSLLIDEAATPLVISSAPPPVNEERVVAIQWASRLAPDAMEDKHYCYLKIEKKPELNNFGRMWVQKEMEITGANSLSMIDRYEIMEKAIQVHRDFIKQKNYLLSEEGEIQLIDQSTGRVGKGRQWSEGIQQAIQAKEKLPITAPNGNLAKVTVQSFFLSFENLSGMTGTARSSASEFRSIYKIGISEIPHHRKNSRVELKPQCFATMEQWLEGIQDECAMMVGQGRSVLIGARNVKFSERVSAHLSACGLKNHLLNARHDGEEASIVSQAGQPGQITVATNMAGRGTDIVLHPEVEKNGGLHVILGGLHESPRIDRQLIGRAARQGDPGSYRIMVSLQDDLLDDAFNTNQASSIRQRLVANFVSSECLAYFKKAQSVMAGRNLTSRKSLFHHEKKQLKHLSRAGMDPLLDFPS